MQRVKSPVNQQEVEKMQRFVRYIIGGCLLFFVIVILGCHACMPSYKEDNIIEESVEELIKQHYGIELDLSLESVET